MAKKDRVNLYNKGRRTWPLVDGEENKSLSPGKSIELDKSLAEKMIKNYPTDFILGNKPEVEVPANVKALKKQVEDLTAENIELKKQVEDLTAGNIEDEDKK